MPVIPSLELTITPGTALYTAPVADANIAVGTSTTEGRTAVVLDFNGGDGLYARDLGTTFSWPTSAGTILHTWQPSLTELPENIYNRASDWQDCGGTGFIQGYEIEADSMAAAKTFQLQSSDDLSYHRLNEMPAVFNKQSVRAFSCAPFIAHSVRRVNTDGVPWRVFREKPIFQPYPELCMEWATEMMSYVPGWQHVRMLNIPYIASQAVTVTLFFDQWPSIVITDQLPATASQLYPTKQLVKNPINKSKLMGFTLTSLAPFRVFKPMVEVHVGQWGRQSSYSVVQPFGGPASEGAEV